MLVSSDVYVLLRVGCYGWMLTTCCCSFGFGGTNAHCILEEYIPSTKKTAFSQSDVLFTPLLFSAASESSLKDMVSQHLSYLRANPEIDLRDLAYTLLHRLAFSWSG